MIETHGSGENLSVGAGAVSISETANIYTSYSPEQIALFTLRHENGYDIFTDVSWLLENHPDDLPGDLCMA